MTGDGGLPGESAASAAPPSGESSRKILDEMRLAVFQRATVPELRGELRWRGQPVGGLKADLIRRLCDEQFNCTWVTEDGFAAAAWVERVCRVRAQLQALRSDGTLGDWVLSQLPMRRR